MYYLYIYIYREREHCKKEFYIALFQVNDLPNALYNILIRRATNIFTYFKSTKTFTLTETHVYFQSIQEVNQFSEFTLRSLHEILIHYNLGVIEKHDIGNCNVNGRRILTFYTEHDFFIKNISSNEENVKKSCAPSICTS